MRPIVQTLSDASAGAKTSNPIIMDYFGQPEVSLQVVVSGTVNWTVQQTLDDPNNGGTVTWFSHPDTNMVSQTVNRQGNYAYIPTSVRLLLSSGTGSATLTVTQTGI